MIQSTGSGTSAFAFTGEQLDASGLTYLRARYYNAYLNQFIQPDTIVPDPRIPADWNRYAYVRNNPINHTDPSGHCLTSTGKDLAANDWSRILEYPIFGPCKDHSNDVLSPNNPHWHYYPTDNVVCPNYLFCSKEEIGDAMIRFAFPGQDPAEPIADGHSDSVWPFKGTQYARFGAIRSIVSQDHLSSSNIALSTHIFYTGRVDRTARRFANGDWHVLTKGYGNNIYFEMDAVNQITGGGIFNFVDLQMRNYIFKKKWLDYISGGCNQSAIT